jgi:fumarylacetoacetase
VTSAQRPDSAVDPTHDVNLASWVDSANGHPDFPIQNLPFGMFDPGVVADRTGEGTRGGIRIGDLILDLRALHDSGVLTGPAQVGSKAASVSLNGLFALGAGPRKDLREQVSRLLVDGSEHCDTVAAMLFPVRDVTVRLPAMIGDFTDFYAGINHATNVGQLFRPDHPLLPNYKWVPIGYHGRASSIHVSGESFARPMGQIKMPGTDAPVFQASRKLDLELELGIWIGGGNAPGHPILIADAASHIAGYCLLNDWSARDIQSWEYQPLGPFLSKSFHSTISAWVVTPEALAPYRAAMTRPAGDPELLSYLHDPVDQAVGGLDIELEVLLTTASMRAGSMTPQRLSLSSTRHMYWTAAQLVAHHTSGGCDLRPGDLLGSGTISGPTPDSCGSLLEITHDGRDTVLLRSGETRTFLEDGDEVVLRARAHRPGVAPIGFGECLARVLPHHVAHGSA